MSEPHPVCSTHCPTHHGPEPCPRCPYLLDLPAAVIEWKFAAALMAIKARRMRELDTR